MPRSSSGGMAWTPIGEGLPEKLYSTWEKGQDDENLTEGYEYRLPNNQWLGIKG